ncbi:phage major capsid protein [Ahrensia kielensis]|uniref:phage major capsid protein n=1 Tax=Ahrensia kielensis TaxID=76980 RepID=UPI00035EA297|nr:phage major capsid protein [Ahrensia kielensis]
MRHDKTFQNTAKASLMAMAAAGKHLQTKDGDPFDILAKKFGDHNTEMLKRIGETDQRVSGVVEAMADIEQKFSRANFSGGMDTSEKTWGEQFTKGEGFESFVEEKSRPGRFRMNVKGTLLTNADSAGALGVPSFRDKPVMLPQRRMTIRSLLNVIKVESGEIEYPAQTSRTNNAAPVAENTKKPESDMAFEMKTAKTRVIAHFVKASRQILEDSSQLRGTIDSELVYGLSLVEEAQLLNGDGTGENLDGMVTNATAYAAPFTVASETMIDRIGLAILQNALADYPATGIIVHHSDWMRMRLLKDTDGKYILGDPQSNVEPNLFGLPVVPTQAMELDKFLVGDFQMAATLYDRWDARVEAGYENDDFTKNRVTLLAEERIALALKRPKALTFGDFGNVS